MTGAEFAAALNTIGWSQRHLAELLGCDTNLPTRWTRGDAAVPKPIQAWLAKLAAAHRSLPPPEWRRRT